jgi:two-component system LytT family response regulator
VRPLSVVIVDDEAPARALLREYLAAEEGVSVLAECADGFDAVRVLSDKNPDLVLLDVQMPKLDGFEVLELLARPPAVVFVTAYDEHALRAFEVNAVDYVLKPVGRDRLERAIERVRERLREGTAAPPARALSRAARPPGQPLQRVIVREGAEVHVIPVARIDWIEAQDDYVALHVQGRTHLKNEPLAEMEKALDPARFVRIHRSSLINLDRLTRLELQAKDARVAVLATGETLPVSRAGYARLKELFGDRHQ